MVPKIAHFYWGGETLPFLRYLTIWSFLKFNPDWEVRFYYPKKRTIGLSWPTHEHKYQVSGTDYTQILRQYVPAVYHHVKIIEIDFSSLGFNDAAAEVHKSDFLRWHILSTEGGLWSDMDILYFKEMSLDLNHKAYLCTNREYGQSIGFLLSSPGNEVFHRIKCEALKTFNPKSYQSMGSFVLNRLNPELQHLDYKNIPMDIVYAYDALHIPEIFKENDRIALRFTERSIGLHWYAGHQLAGKYINLVNFGNFYSFKSVLAEAIRMSMEVYHGDVIARGKGN